MRDFNRGGNYRSNNRGGGFDRNSRGRSNNDRQMHDAVCSECGRDCQVPFFPTGNKPVFCSDCFERNNSNSGSFNERRPSSSSRDRSFSRPQNDSNKSLDEVNQKLDRILKLLTKKEEVVVDFTEIEEKPKKKVKKAKKA